MKSDFDKKILDSLWNFLLVIFKDIWPNSYGFWDKRGQMGAQESKAQNAPIYVQFFSIEFLWKTALTVSEIWEDRTLCEKNDILFPR
jgi:hypothetical protein